MGMCGWDIHSGKSLQLELETYAEVAISTGHRPQTGLRRRKGGISISNELPQQQGQLNLLGELARGA